jgi:hypothetical protein
MTAKLFLACALAAVAILTLVFGALRASAAEPVMTQVETDGLRGHFYAAPGKARGPAVLMLDGAGGGYPVDEGPARDLATSGSPTLALAYFRNHLGVPDGLPPTLAEIWLEYVFRAIDWLKAQPQVGADRIVIMGLSRGAELALLVASQRRDVAGVVAFSPSNLVWQSQSYGGPPQAAWTLNGQPIPYIAYGAAPGKAMVDSTSVVLDRDDAAVAAATIPVERIGGPILLVSSTADQVWTAARMADLVEARLKARRFAFPVTNLHYDDASHLLMGPGPARIRVTVGSYTIELGGTEAGTRKARDAAWAETKRFLARLKSR